MLKEEENSQVTFRVKIRSKIATKINDRSKCLERSYIKKHQKDCLSVPESRIASIRRIKKRIWF